MGLIKQITGNREVQQMDGTWKCVATEKVLKEAGNHSQGAYISKRQTTVAEWGALKSIMEVCDKETCYEIGGRLHDTWLRKTAARKQMSDMLKYILTAAR